MKDDVLVTRAHGVMTITLNRPSKLNALTFEMHDLINAAITEAEQDPQSRVLVITAVGRAFCAGDDLKESDPRGTAAPEEYTSVDWHKFVRRLRALPKPTIAALNGLCCGAGIGLDDVRNRLSGWFRQGSITSRGGRRAEGASAAFAILYPRAFRSAG